MCIKRAKISYVQKKKLNVTQKVINFDDVKKENIKEHNLNWPQIPYQPCRILIVEGSGSGKTNSLFRQIRHQREINKKL